LVFISSVPTVRLQSSVAEPHHFYSAPASGKNLDSAAAPTLLQSKAKFLKFKRMLKLSFTFIFFCTIYIAETMN
jgi:hypothetical protein